MLEPKFGPDIAKLDTATLAKKSASIPSNKLLFWRPTEMSMKFCPIKVAVSSICSIPTPITLAFKAPAVLLNAFAIGCDINFKNLL